MSLGFSVLHGFKLKFAVLHGFRVLLVSGFEGFDAKG